MGSIYYTENKDNYSHPTYAGYRHRILWNEASIAGTDRANGYIVQRVSFDINTPGIGKSEDYYEAWQVVNGSCKTTDGYDDEFTCDDPFLANNLFNSIGRTDIIQYRTKVYWVSKDSELYAIVDSWEPGHAPMANQLKSVYVRECPVFEETKELFQRTFTHNYDCTSDERIIDAIKHYYRNQISNGLTYWIKDVKARLCGPEYEHIIGLITP